MLTKDLVIFGVSCAMPCESLRRGKELRATALAPAVGYLAIEATDPRFHLRGREHNKFDTAPVMNSLAVMLV